MGSVRMETWATEPASVMMVSLALPVRSVRIQMLMEKGVIKCVTVNMECVIKVLKVMESVCVSHHTLGRTVTKRIGGATIAARTHTAKERETPPYVNVCLDTGRRHRTNAQVFVHRGIVTLMPSAPLGG